MTNLLACSYTHVLKDNEFLELTVEDFDIECDHDKFTVTNSYDDTVLFDGGCRRFETFSITIDKSKSLKVSFVADGSVKKAGGVLKHRIVNNGKEMSLPFCPGSEVHGTCYGQGSCTKYVCVCDPKNTGEDCSGLA